MVVAKRRKAEESGDVEIKPEEQKKRRRLYGNAARFREVVTTNILWRLLKCPLK